MDYHFGVLVVEAGYRSGASLTANIAIKQGKPVFSVPSNLDNKNCRTNELIQKGAKLIISSDEIIKECNIKVNIAESQFTPVKSKISIETVIAKEMKLNSIEPEYKDIYKILLDKPLNINEICVRTKRDIGDISSSLTMLELEGYVEQLPGKLFKILE